MSKGPDTDSASSSGGQTIWRTMTLQSILYLLRFQAGTLLVSMWAAATDMWLVLAWCMRLRQADGHSNIQANQEGDIQQGHDRDVGTMSVAWLCALHAPSQLATAEGWLDSGSFAGINTVAAWYHPLAHSGSQGEPAHVPSDAAVRPGGCYEP